MEIVLLCGKKHLDAGSTNIVAILVYNVGIFVAVAEQALHGGSSFK
jgi:hypothetical protein